MSVEPFHLFRYLDEQTYRFNHRKLTDAERFSLAVSGIADKRVTYEELTGKSLRVKDAAPDAVQRQAQLTCYVKHSRLKLFQPYGILAVLWYSFVREWINAQRTLLHLSSG